MHPKSLESLCVDELVDATVRYQRVCSCAKNLWRAVDEVWRDVWQLGGSLATRAAALLHAHLLCQHLLGEVTKHAGRVRVPDAAPALITLLAAKSQTVSLVPVEPQLFRLGPAAAAVLCCDHFPLTELILTGIDMESKLDFLLHVLPCCKRLSVLKLGGNCTAAVLEAARGCPLKVLHLSERQVWQPRMTEAGLGKFLIGCVGAMKYVLDNVRRGEQPNFQTAWPNLTDLCVGWCKVSVEFLLLLLVAVPRLQYLSSKIVDTSVIVRQYVDLASEVSSLHKLSLRAISVISENFSKTYHCYPSASKLHVLNVTDVERFLWELLGVSMHLSNLQVLKLTLIPGPIPHPPSLFLKQEFAHFGKHIKELHLEKGHGGLASTLLILFPSVQRLHITGDAMLIPKETGLKITYPSVSKLECVCSDSAQLLLYLVRVFPNLETLILKSQRGGMALQWEQLNELGELKNLTLLGTLVENIPDLCLIPRKTTDKRHWQLSVVPGSVTSKDMKKLRWCGWTCFYVKDYS